MIVSTSLHFSGVISQEMLNLVERIPALERKVEALSISAAIVDKVFVYNEDAVTRTSNRPFKENLLTAYNIRPRHTANGLLLIRCMLTGAWLPCATVIASHIVKHMWNEYRLHETLGMEVDDVGNGLLLFKPIEWALDNSKICFVYDEGFRTFNMRILDPLLNDKTLLSVLEHPPSNSLRKFASDLSNDVWNALVDNIGSLTFGGFKDRWLDFEGMSHQRPFKRALCFHARRARAYALQQQWIAAGDVTFDDFWSEGDYKIKVTDWLATLDAAVN